MNLNVEDLAFHTRLGRLMDHLDQPAFWPELAGFLREWVGFDTWVAVRFRNDAPPLVLADHAVNYAQDDLFADYMRGLYLLDPFHTFALKSLVAGVYRLDEVAPDDFRDTEYFRRYFSLNVVADELQFLLPQVDGTLSLSLGSRHRFSAREVGTCNLFVPWLLPALRLAAASTQTPSMPPQVKTQRSELEEALRQCGSPALTRREVEVALLVLAGHSTKGVARELAISLETAKVHRRNLYAKLGVSSQAALFLLFADLQRRSM